MEDYNNLEGEIPSELPTPKKEKSKGKEAKETTYTMKASLSGYATKGEVLTQKQYDNIKNYIPTLDKYVKKSR